MVTKQRKNHQFLAIKNAVELNEISLDEANNIIIKQKREDNMKVIESSKEGSKSFQRLFHTFAA